MATPKIPRELRRVFDKHGAKILGVRANKHFVVTLRLPDGRTHRETCAQSASDARAIKNVEARLLRVINSPKETSE